MDSGKSPVETTSVKRHSIAGLSWPPTADSIPAKVKVKNADGETLVSGNLRTVQERGDGYSWPPLVELWLTSDGFFGRRSAFSCASLRRSGKRTRYSRRGHRPRLKMH